MDDTQILDKIRNGNTSLYKEIIHKYERLIAATITAMIGHCTEVEDIGQEVFIRFYKAIPNFRGESSISTYITRIAINLSLNELKRRKRRDQVFLNSDNYLLENIGVSKGDGDKEDKELIQKAIQKLEPKFRTVITLRMIDGYSTQDTAEILEVPIGTVLSRLARAQQKLKKILSPVMEVQNG
jgi:RNA polymerase sigma-70 factor (ECF subfamily)